MSQFKRVTIVGPLAPPAGGMANQTKKLAEFLRAENIIVDVIRTNPEYKPAFIGKLPVIRALFRLVSYKLTLMKRLKNTDVIHIMANSGWSWHLFAAPAIFFGRLYNKPVVLNYRGGYAADFFSESWFWVDLTLKKSQVIVVPSIFLQEVFDDFDKSAVVIPNVLDKELFFQATNEQKNENAPHLIVTRNLEAIYDVATTVKAFALVIKEFPEARLSIAGTGPEKQALTMLIAELKLNDSVFFTGRLCPEEMAKLYQQADVMLNASTVDNTPNSIIEALACATPVVSTDAGGIPKLVKHRQDALLVNIADHQKMADAALEILKNPTLQQTLVNNGLQTIKKFYWANVWLKLKACYDEAIINNRKK
ncbi:glycosyltransferase family 4 protein [Colwellia psychrerythraea]|uniref:Glycosyl transferase group 1 n=1 Tax=Colwellia psychrerythraea TaxID=28229 RepID=A0A099L3Q0_COLPS|nr:glycosyltransferase family 4 protein [Colwellia psychrerythraea]KGJ96777.1 glycosyl transferase group 1 [Colwellia psychrerythraea]